jgi:hypothetical protein
VKEMVYCRAITIDQRRKRFIVSENAFMKRRKESFSNVFANFIQSFAGPKKIFELLKISTKQKKYSN